MLPPKSIALFFPGDMGSGLSRLFAHHAIKTYTNLTGRSSRTINLSTSSGLENLSSDTELLKKSELIISILPPSHAKDIAKRIISAIPPSEPIITKYFLDANAISPATAREINSFFDGTGIKFIDGAIVGEPPKLKEDGTWGKPTLLLSGPERRELGLEGIIPILDAGEDIGKASALKMSFASLTKGFSAIAIQSLGSAQYYNLLGPLFTLLQSHNPRGYQQIQNLVGIPPKAYRWVGEMEEIEQTFAEAGFDGGTRIFGGVAGTYKFVSEGTVLGREIVERNRGKTVEDLVEALGEGLAKHREEKGEE